MKSYEQFVGALAKSVREAKSIPLGAVPALAKPDLLKDAPVVLFFSPHPDDESIAGGLAWRLLQEAKWNTINVAVTQGSKKERQAGRLLELKGACNYLGFGLEQTAANGLESVTLATRSSNWPLWAKMVKVILEILARYEPKVIFFPHADDWNGTHIGVHHLVMDALEEGCRGDIGRRLPQSFTTYCVETEFWRASDHPNLQVEYDEQDVAALVTATSFHVGEVERNPYHLLLPAWLMDNVRRGAEIVGGQGQAAPDFMFSQLFRVSKWQNGKLHDVFPGGRILSKKENAANLFAD